LFVLSPPTPVCEMLAHRFGFSGPAAGLQSPVEPASVSWFRVVPPVAPCLRFWVTLAVFVPVPLLDWTRSARPHPSCVRLNAPDASCAIVCVMLARFDTDAPLWLTIAVWLSLSVVPFDPFCWLTVALFDLPT